VGTAVRDSPHLQARLVLPADGGAAPGARRLAWKRDFKRALTIQKDFDTVLEIQQRS
jgi:hypothetical protein